MKARGDSNSSSSSNREAGGAAAEHHIGFNDCSRAVIVLTLRYDSYWQQVDSHGTQDAVIVQVKYIALLEF